MRHTSVGGSTRVLHTNRESVNLPIPVGPHASENAGAIVSNPAGRVLRISLEMSELGHKWSLRVITAAIAAAAVTALAVVGPLWAALPSTEEIAFKVFRDGEPLGHHRVTFRREAQDLHVEIDIQLEIKLAFITVFRYRHSNREVWRRGRLVAIDTETDDDGEGFWLRGRASDVGFEIEGSSGSFVAPADVMPTSYWNPETVTKNRLLDTQRGRLIAVQIASAGSEIVSVGGQLRNTQRYRMTGDLELDLWYATDGEWAKISFEARGAEVVYARADEPDTRPATEDTVSGQ